MKIDRQNPATLPPALQPGDLAETSNGSLVIYLGDSRVVWIQPCGQSVRRIGDVDTYSNIMRLPTGTRVILEQE